MATGDSLFHLNRLISATDIKLSARCESGRRHLLAFVTESGHLSLYYIRGAGRLPVLRVVPWFTDTTKRIAALTFDPSGAWLLVAGHDGTVYIVPALSLVDPTAALDHRWSNADITTFPTNLSNTTSPNPANLNCRISRPTAIAWWQCIMDCQHIAVVGTDRGDIAFVSLTANAQVGLTYVKASISTIHVCQDNSLDNVFLLITSDQRSQWKLLLEQRATGYIWPLDNVNNKGGGELNSSHSGSDPDFGARATVLPTARSRLQGLKQLSVEKLASLRQRLAETRTKGKDSHNRRGSSSSSSDESQARTRKTSSSSLDPDWSSSGPIPDRLSPHVGDTFLQPQYARGRYILSGYYAPNSILTIHGMSLEVVPLFVHKLAPSRRDVLVTDRFLYVTDEDCRNLSVVSCQFAESRLDGDSEYNPDAIVDSFTFLGDERILALYKVTDLSRRTRTHSHGKRSRSSRERSGERAGGGARGQRGSKEREGKKFTLPKEVADLDVEEKLVDTCVVVTTSGVYHVALRRPPVEQFMDLVLKRQELEKAERLANMFGMDLQQLLESAGDLKLAQKQFAQAISLYKLSRCRHLKSVLKFAAAGHSKELLSYITMLFSTANVELSASERIHLANLAVMAYTDQGLRAVKRVKVTLFKQFLYFLRTNLNYDEVLAVNIAGQTGLWDVLQYLASQRGLHLEVLDILTKILRSLLDAVKDGSAVSRNSPALDAGLWMCVSNPSHLQSLLVRPQLSKTHVAFVACCLPQLDLATLERLAALFDPSSPVLRPLVKRSFAASRRRLYSTVSNDSFASFSGLSDSVDTADSDDLSGNNPVDEMMQTFVLVLVHLNKKRTQDPRFDAALIGHVKPTDADDEVPTFMDVDEALTAVPLSANLVGAGYCHAALVRNASLFTWGNAVQGCLGTGPTMTRYSCAQQVSLFPSLKVEVLSVSCGRQHTLALTTNGVYAWGSSQYGQLGVGPIGQSAWPLLVHGLARQRVAAVSAGQYHSLALTSDGRVFSWGWGVHGQLGHRSVEDCDVPCPIERLSGRGVTQVAAGHGHSLALTADGDVYVFGSSIFGQLGCGLNSKSTVPIKVEGILEPVVNIATNYFHNLAVTVTNRLYIWGASPQVLRLQAQAQKKARLMQQHYAQTPTAPQSDPVTPSVAKISPEILETVIAKVDLASPVVDITDVEMTTLKRTDNETERVQNETNQNVDDATINGQVLARNNVVDNRNTDAFDTSTKKSFTQSVHDYFVEPKMAPTESSQNNGNGAGTEMSVMAQTAHESSGEVKTDGDGANVTPITSVSVRTASSEGYVLPTIVISPTMERERAVVAAKKTSPVMRTPRPPPAYLLDDNAQTHLLPQLVDTSLVAGQIVQISCGCHHSALVTKEGVLYTWGRNLDGQLGTGGRREVVIPTAVTSASSPAGKGGGIASVIPPACDKLRVQQVSCGCEFTVALDAQSSKLWAWGNNAQAQLGKAPIDDPKAMEGRVLMIKTVKRVIKLPHGSQNSVDTPREVPNLPSSSITFRQSPRDAFLSGSYPDELPPLVAIEDPPYGPRTLHYVLQRLHGHYDSTQVTKRSIELEDYQSAAKLAALDRHFHLALTYQLKALVSATKRSVTKTDLNQNESTNLVSLCDNDISLDNRSNKDEEANGNVGEINDDNAGLILNENVLDSNVNVVSVSESENRVIEESEVNGVCSGISEIKIIDNEDVQVDNEDRPKESSEVQFDDLGNKLSEVKVDEAGNELSEVRVDEVGNKLSGIRVDDVDEFNELSEVKDGDVTGNRLSEVGVDEVGNVTAEKCSVSLCSTPESVLSTPTNDGSEIHTFSIQGGNEEMSEGRQDDVTSPTDTVSPASKESSPLDLETADNNNESKVAQRNDTTSTSVITTGVDLCAVVESPPSGGVQTEMTPDPAASNIETPVVKKVDAELVTQAARVVEYYVSEMEDDGHAMMSRILQQGMDFWMSHALPVERLESLLTKHMAKFFYPLGLLLFNTNTSHKEENEDPASMLDHLSTKFCLQLCSTLLAHINQSKAHPEYVDMLADAASAPLGRANGRGAPPEQLVEAILTKLGGAATLPQYITSPAQATDAGKPDRVFAFSCGHRYTAADLHQVALPEMSHRLPNTALVLKNLFEQNAHNDQLACPKCVLRHVDAGADNDVA